MPVSDVNSAVYSARCPACAHARPMTRAEVATGRNPACDKCGTIVTVLAQLGSRQPSGHVEARE